jgi:lysyl-tRNA synthetase class 2
MDFPQSKQAFEARFPRLKVRSQIIRFIRAFFENKGFCAVESNILQVMPGADVHIHAFQTTQFGLDHAPLRDIYLHQSPEFAMKKLLVAGRDVGLDKIYQIVPVFRNCEDSKLHSAEFTMIEWYRTHDCYETIMQDCEDLLIGIARDLNITEFRFKDRVCNALARCKKLRVRDAFQKFYGFDLADVLNDRDAFVSALGSNCGFVIRDNDSWDDIFFAAMAHKIEPNLGHGNPTILYEYPAHMAALSRVCDDDKRFAKRFELYVCGVELANAFDELTDAAEQRKRFVEDMAEKQKIYGNTFPIDEEFLTAIEYGLPPTGGIALGVDRLIMLATNADTIDDVLWWGKV